jgi:hypothetical protein
LAAAHLPDRAEGSPAVTTADAVQAACALLLHAAQGLSLLPVAPHCVGVMVQLPAPTGYLGNAVHVLRVSLPPGTAQPAEGDYAGALQQLASAIRQATVAFRSRPVRALQHWWQPVSAHWVLLLLHSTAVLVAQLECCQLESHTLHLWTPAHSSMLAGRGTQSDC